MREITTRNLVTVDKPLTKDFLRGMSGRDFGHGKRPCKVIISKNTFNIILRRVPAERHVYFGYKAVKLIYAYYKYSAGSLKQGWERYLPEEELPIKEDDETFL